MIKPNIDLTKNEMFSKPRINRIPSAKLTRRHFHEIRDDYDLSPESQPVLTGDKKERELKKIYLEENSRNYCDCCGGHIFL